MHTSKSSQAKQLLSSGCSNCSELMHAQRNYEENSETQLLSIIPSHNSIKLQRTFLLVPELE